MGLMHVVAVNLTTLAISHVPTNRLTDNNINYMWFSVELTQAYSNLHVHDVFAKMHFIHLLFYG